MKSIAEVVVLNLPKLLIFHEIISNLRHQKTDYDLERT